MNRQYTNTVYISCMTFNHANYIEDAMHGFVMQQTNFPYVAVVVDDASTDGEPEVIRQFLEKEFDMPSAVQNETEDYVRIVAKHKTNVNCTFVVVFLKYNHYSIRKARLPYIKEWYDNAQYIALCEGDDYWTDPLKLQRQVNFLEEHEEYSMCCHGADLINLSDRAVDCLCDRMTTRDYTFEDAFPTWQIPTASIVYNRAKVESFVLRKQECFMAGDVVLILRCMSVGLVHGFKEHMSVYRVHPGGATRVKSTDAITERWCKHLDALALNFPQIDVSYCRRFAAKHYYTRFRKAHNVADKVKFFAIACAKSPKYVIAKLLMPFGGTKSAILKKWTYVEYS